MKEVGGGETDSLGVERKMEVAKKMFVRLPAEVDAWIEQQAKDEDRSKTAVVVRALRARKQLQEQAAR
jgi:predicted HicB family RNase H-like nuclease